MTLIRLVTCTALPEPDPDEDLLRDALVARGLDAAWVAWNDPAARWQGGLSVLRSTWDYYHAPDAFLAWAERAGREGALWNPPRAVRWNAHKRYLVELCAQGFPVVPTELVPRGSSEPLDAVRGRRGWDAVVVKPAVSAGSFRTVRLAAGAGASEREAAGAHLAALTAAGDALVQPYVRSVEGHGERAVVCIDGALTHAVRKTPRFTGDDEQVSHALAIEPAERAVAEAVLARHGAGLLYARVDLARDDDGQPMVMELELIEPSLFLAQEPAALARLASAIARLAAP